MFIVLDYYGQKSLEELKGQDYIYFVGSSVMSLQCQEATNGTE